MRLEVGHILDDRYELKRELGVGGMGSVWEVRELATGRRLAVKLLHERLMSQRGVPERFLREAQAAFEAKFSGHIVEVLDVVAEDDEPPYIVMEYLEGADIRQILQEEGAFSPRRAVDLVIQACNGLDEVHRRGLVHRDIKPGNLFVTRLPDGTEWVKLLDFGLVKLGAALQSGRKQLTDFGVSLGTFQYMAPEQSTRPSEVDERADVFALGVVLYEMLAKATPFDTEKVGVRGVIEKREPTPLRSHCPDIDAGLELVVAKAMAVNPRRRWASMFDFVEALEPYSSSSPAPQDSIPEMDPEKPTIDESLSMLEQRALLLEGAEGEPEEQAPIEGAAVTAPFKVLALILGAVLIAGAIVALRSSRGPVTNEGSTLQVSLEHDSGTVDGRAGKARRLGADRRVAKRDDEPPLLEWGDGAEDGQPIEAEPAEPRPLDPPQGTLAFSRWIRTHYGDELGSVLDDVGREIEPCLEASDFRAGSEVTLQMWVEGDGSMSFRKSRPWLVTPVRRCVMKAVASQRFRSTGFPRFVITRRYGVPGR